MAKINEDKRGLFVELWRESKDGIQFVSKPQQISWLTINPGCFRGGHYHKNQYEYFILIEGECEISLSMPVSKEENEKYGWFGVSGNQIKMKQFEMITVPCGFQHTLFSKTGAKVLVLSNKEFNEKDQDTYVY